MDGADVEGIPGDPAATGGGVFPNVKDVMPKTFGTVAGAIVGRVPKRLCCCEVEGTVVGGTRGENVTLCADLFGAWPNKLLAGGVVAGR